MSKAIGVGDVNSGDDSKQSSGDGEDISRSQVCGSSGLTAVSVVKKRLF